MELSPHAIASATFRIVKKGFDPDEVRTYLSHVAGTVEQAQNQSTAMEARARAAVAKLQEITQQAAAAPQQPSGAAAKGSDDDVEAISRTLLLAQRTADNLVSEARAEAEQMRSSATAEASGILDEARTTATRTVEEATEEARRSAEAVRLKVEGEVQALLARRDFLVSDVEHLEAFIESQRERVRAAADSLVELAERGPAGLGEARRPLLSAAGDLPRAIEAAGVIEPEPTPVMQLPLAPPSEAAVAVSRPEPGADLLPPSADLLDPVASQPDDANHANPAVQAGATDTTPANGTGESGEESKVDRPDEVSGDVH